MHVIFLVYHTHYTYDYFFTRLDTLEEGPRHFIFTRTICKYFSTTYIFDSHLTKPN